MLDHNLETFVVTSGLNAVWFHLGHGEMQKHRSKLVGLYLVGLRTQKRTKKKMRTASLNQLIASRPPPLRNFEHTWGGIWMHLASAAVLMAMERKAQHVLAVTAWRNLGKQLLHDVGCACFLRLLSSDPLRSCRTCTSREQLLRLKNPICSRHPLHLNTPHLQVAALRSLHKGQRGSGT